jgi:hypothetical protein
MTSLGLEALGAEPCAGDVLVTLQGNGLAVFDMGSLVSPDRLRRPRQGAPIGPIAVLRDVARDGKADAAPRRHSPQAVRQSRPLGSHARFVAPVQAHGDRHVAGLQLGSGPAHVLVALDPASRAPIADAPARVTLAAGLHAMHVLHPPAAAPTAPSTSGACTAVVLADGSVGAVSWEQLVVQPAAGASGSGSGGDSGDALASASDRGLLAVARQQAAGGVAAVTLYAARTADGLAVVGSCSVEPPAAGCRLAALSLAASTLALVWSDAAISVAHVSHQQGRATVSSSVHIATSSVLGSGAAAPTANGTAAAGRKRKVADAAPAPATGQPPVLCHALPDGGLLVARVAEQGGGVACRHAVIDGHYGVVLAAGSAQLEGLAWQTAAASTSRLLLLHTTGGLGHAALLSGGRMYALHLALPSADLAGLVGRMALAGPGPASSGPGGERTPAVVAAASDSSSSSSSGSHTSSKPAVVPEVRLDLSALLPPLQPQQQERGLELLQPPPAVTTSSAGGGTSQAAAVSGVAAAAQHVEQLLSAAAAAAPPSKAALQKEASRLLHALQGAAGAALVAPPLLGRLAEAMAEAGLWQQLETLLQTQPMHSLVHCPALLAAAAGAQQYALLAQLCVSAQDVPAPGLVAAMQQLLSPASSSTVTAAQQRHCQQARRAAEAAVSQAEAAAAAAGGGEPHALAPLVAAAKRAACAVDGFTAREVCLHPLVAANVDWVEAGGQLRQLSNAQVRGGGLGRRAPALLACDPSTHTPSRRKSPTSHGLHA